METQGEFRETLPDTDWAWLAGFIDGEGHLAIRRQYAEKKTPQHRRRGENKEVDGWFFYSPRLSICNNYRPAIQIAAGLLQGNVHKRTMTHYINRPIHSVEITARQRLVKMLPRVLPYLIVKREIAELVYQFVCLPRGSDSQKEALWKRAATLSQAEYVRLPGVSPTPGTQKVRRSDLSESDNGH